MHEPDVGLEVAVAVALALLLGLAEAVVLEALAEAVAVPVGATGQLPAEPFMSETASLNSVAAGSRS